MIREDWIIEVVAANVRKHRENIGISQEALAAKAGVHRTYMSQIERGLSNLTIVALARIAKALGVRPEQLLVSPLPEPRAGPHKTQATKKTKGK